MRRSTRGTAVGEGAVLRAVERLLAERLAHGRGVLDVAVAHRKREIQFDRIRMITGVIQDDIPVLAVVVGAFEVLDIGLVPAEVRAPHEERARNLPRHHHKVAPDDATIGRAHRGIAKEAPTP